MVKTKRTKKPKCTKASAYACGFSCITMTKTCRQELEGQSTEIASLFAKTIAETAPAIDDDEFVEEEWTQDALQEFFKSDTNYTDEPGEIDEMGPSVDDKPINSKKKQGAFGKAKIAKNEPEVASKSGDILFSAKRPEFLDFEDIAADKQYIGDKAMAEQLKGWTGETLEIAWSLTGNQPANEKEALGKALEARRLWPELQKKLKPGTLLYNTPTADATADGLYKNTRARLYERSGFGKLEQAMMPRQMAIVQADGTLKPVQTLKPKGFVKEYSEA